MSPFTPKRSAIDLIRSGRKVPEKERDLSFEAVRDTLTDLQCQRMPPESNIEY